MNSNSNSNNSVLINIVATLYLISRNVDFVFIIVFPGYFRFEFLQEQFLG